MLPRLSGEEAIRGANVAAVGAGSLSKEDRRAVVDAWERQASPQPVQRGANPQQMRAIGIGVRAVQKRP